MRRFFREVAYDLKEPGVLIWIIPVVTFVFVAMTYFVQKNLDMAGKENLITLPLLETFVPTLGGYGALMLMQGLLDTEGGEIAFTYPRSHLYWGLIRQFRFFVIDILLVAGICKCVSSIMHINFTPIFLLTLAQSFAVMAVSFFGIALGKKVSIGLIVLFAFVGIQIMIGREFETLNWIYVINGSVPSQEQLNTIVLNALLIGVFGWGIGQVWVRP